MSIIFQYKNTSLDELSHNTHFNTDELENVLIQCMELDGLKIYDIYCIFEQTSHSTNPFECEVILKIEGPDIRVIRDGKEPFGVALNVCKKALKISRIKSHKETKIHPIK
jgi:hypothetical protein